MSQMIVTGGYGFSYGEQPSSKYADIDWSKSQYTVAFNIESSAVNFSIESSAVNFSIVYFNSNFNINTFSIAFNVSC